MSVHHQRTVIIGAGQAGVQVADSLRTAGYRGRITLLADEQVLPYQRPQLSKDLLGMAEAEPLPLRPENFYADNDIELIRGVTVTSIDANLRQITLATGEPLDYTDVVIATGTRARPLPVPGSDFAGVHTIRTLDDALRLRGELHTARRVVVVGAGFIGLEVAAIARHLELPVTVLAGPNAPLERVVSPAVSRWFTTHHAAMGVDIVTGQSAVAFAGDGGRVSSVVTDSGACYDADVVIVGVGAVPNVELAAGSGIAVVDGVVVDEYLQTSEPGIWAVGDCASYPGHPNRVESVQNAVDQGRLLAHNLLAALEGDELTRYSALPWFWSHQGTAKLQIAGLRTPDCRETVVLGKPENNKFSVLCFNADDELVAVESVNSPGDHMAARKVLSRAIPLSRAVAAAEGFNLKAHSRAALITI